MIYLIKRGLSERSPNRPPLKITVVEYDEDHKLLHDHPLAKGIERSLVTPLTGLQKPSAVGSKAIKQIRSNDRLGFL